MRIFLCGLILICGGCTTILPKPLPKNAELWCAMRGGRWVVKSVSEGSRHDEKFQLTETASYCEMDN